MKCDCRYWLEISVLFHWWNAFAAIELRFPRMTWDRRQRTEVAAIVLRISINGLEKVYKIESGRIGFKRHEVRSDWIDVLNVGFGSDWPFESNPMHNSAVHRRSCCQAFIAQLSGSSFRLTWKALWQNGSYPKSWFFRKGGFLIASDLFPFYQNWFRNQMNCVLGTKYIYSFEVYNNSFIINWAEVIILWENGFYPIIIFCWRASNKIQAQTMSSDAKSLFVIDYWLDPT